MSVGQVRQHCERLAAGIVVPSPFGVEVFLDQLSSDRGRPVRLLRFPLPAGTPCGLLISTESSDYVVVSEAVSGIQADHVALHEVAHLLCGHPLNPLSDTSLRRLLPHLDSSTVQAMLSRGGYSTVEEQEAEILASLLRQRAGLWNPSRRTNVSDPLLRRLGHSLEHGDDG